MKLRNVIKSGSTKRHRKKFIIWILISLISTILIIPKKSSAESYFTTQFSDFLSSVSRGQVTDTTIEGSVITGHFTDGRTFITYAPVYPNLIDRLIERGVRIAAVPPDKGISTLDIVLITWLPLLLLGGIWIGFQRQRHNDAQVLIALLSKLEGRQHSTQRTAPDGPPTS